MENWYIYQNKEQLGPFAKEQIVQMLKSGLISGDAYLFTIGWSDWRRLAECKEELLGLAHPLPAPPLPKTQSEESSAEAESRRIDTPRMSISGRVIVHNRQNLVIGAGVNISDTGIFVTMQDQVFSINEILSLTVQTDGLVKDFNVKAKVIRYSDDDRYPRGYGFQFQGLADKVKREISAAISGLNHDRASTPRSIAKKI